MTPSERLLLDATAILVKLFGGSRTFGKVVLWEDDLGAANGWSAPLLPFLVLNWKFLRGATNSYAAASCGGLDGECACIVAEIAATILHEISHQCGASEQYAHLLGYWYLLNFQQKNGYGNRNCCAAALGAPPTWDEFFYSYDSTGLNPLADDVRRFTNRLNFGKGGTGMDWVLADCSMTGPSWMWSV